MCRMALYYHMYGDDVDTLTVWLRFNIGGSMSKLWSHTGNVGNWFERADIPIPAGGRPFQVPIDVSVYTIYIEQ